jgi:FkbM family methyltransferase
MAFFLSTLKQAGFLSSIHTTICNVGSRKIFPKDDYGGQGWDVFAPNLTIYGFDADADACDQANQDIEARQVNWQEKHLPFALSSSVDNATLYVTANPICSSLYPPNEPFLQRFVNLPELVNLDFTVELETTTLDAVCVEQDIQQIDFLQIDVQGANLLVLKGAQTTLAHSVLAIQVEVEFSELYTGQALFADVDHFLRQQGFALFDLASAARQQRSPLHSPDRPGQLLWADAIYLRDPLQAKPRVFYTQPEQLLKLACIADILEFTDYALELLEHLTLNYGTEPRYNLADSIAQSLLQVPEIAQSGLAIVPTINKLKDFLTQPLPAE